MIRGRRGLERRRTPERYGRGGRSHRRLALKYAENCAGALAAQVRLRIRRAARSGGCRRAGAPRICACEVRGRSCSDRSFEVVARLDGFCGAIEARKFFGLEKTVGLDPRDHAVFEIDEAAIPVAL